LEDRSGRLGDRGCRAADCDDEVGFLPPPDFEATTLEEFMVLGHIMTATRPLNAIPPVVAAAPGIVTYNDLPLMLPRGVVPQV
jgi:hypothetical protein